MKKAVNRMGWLGMGGMLGEEWMLSGRWVMEKSRQTCQTIFLILIGLIEAHDTRAEVTRFASSSPAP